MLPKAYPKTFLLMFNATTSLIIINFVSSNLLHSMSSSTKVNSSIPNNPASLNATNNMDKQAILKILDIFRSTYSCNEDTNTAEEHGSNSSSISDTSEDKATSRKLDRICFPNNWPVTIYAASSTDKSDYTGNEENPYRRGGLRIRHVEEWIQNGNTDENGCGLVVVVDLYPFHKFGHPVAIYRTRGIDYLDPGSYHSAEDIELIEELTANRSECSKQSSPPETSDLPEGTNPEAVEEQKFLDCHYNFLPTVTTRSGSKQLLKCLTNRYFTGSSGTDRLQIADEWCRLEKRRAERSHAASGYGSGKAPSSSSSSLPSSSVSSSSPRASVRKSPTLSSRPIRSRSSSSSSSIDWTHPRYFHPSPGQCHLFTICDHAVVVSGGWNRWSVTDQDRRFSREMVRMLKKFGFPGRNIQFFSGFQGSSDRDKLSPNGFFRAKSKIDIRNQLSYLCTKEHCVNALALYLNAPTLANGAMLLGDEDADEVANITREVYTIEELTEDLKDCRAQQVLVLADQTNSHKLVELMRVQAPRFAFTAAYVSGRGYEVPKERHLNKYTTPSPYFLDHSNYHQKRPLPRKRNNSGIPTGIPNRRFAFTSTWLDINHTRHCIQDVFQEAKRKSLPHSIADSFKGSFLPQHNIYGAPCGSHRLLSKRDLEENYFGCQNLPRRLIEYRALRAKLPQDCDKREGRKHPKSAY